MSRRDRSAVIVSRSAMIVRSTGDAGIGLARDPRGDRMCPVLSCTDAEGRFIKLELTPLMCYICTPTLPSCWPPMLSRSHAGGTS